jgi:hypothetical protein
MLASLLRLFRLGPPRKRYAVRSDSAEWLASLGLTSAHDFLNLPGVVVSGHVGRNVSRVRLGTTTAYLKREHRVRRRDRFRSWLDGFGWSSISAREAAVLRRLDEHGLPGPRWLAYGEADGQAFLLLEEAVNGVELRSLPVVDGELARRLGEIIAGIHVAGIDQPDLFAKHILVGGPIPAELGARCEVGAAAKTPSRPNGGEPDRVSSGRFWRGSERTLAQLAPGTDATGLAVGRQWLTILDWQRATVRRRVTRRQRVSSLASLRATALPDVLPESTWHCLVAVYLRAARNETAIDRWLTAIDLAAARMRRRKKIRSQRVPAGAAVNQELVRIGGETVCAVPELGLLFNDPAAVARVYDPANHGQPISLPDTRAGLLRVSRYVLPLARWLAVIRGKPWRSPELKIARLLFHLERHGIPAPKLQAYGQTVPRVAPAGSFVLFEPLAADPLRPEHETAALELLDRLHEAECRLIEVGRGGEPFGVIDGRIVIRDPTRVRLTRRLRRRHMEGGRASLRDFFRGLA